MRNLIIDEILNSSKWQKCVNSGLSSDLPNLSKLCNNELLSCYSFYVACV